MHFDDVDVLETRKYPACLLCIIALINRTNKLTNITHLSIKMYINTCKTMFWLVKPNTGGNKVKVQVRLRNTINKLKEIMEAPQILNKTCYANSIHLLGKLH